MKFTKLLILLLVCAGFTLTSCNKEDEETYCWLIQVQTVEENSQSQSDYVWGTEHDANIILEFYKRSFAKEFKGTPKEDFKIIGIKGKIDDFNNEQACEGEKTSKEDTEL